MIIFPYLKQFFPPLATSFERDRAYFLHSFCLFISKLSARTIKLLSVCWYPTLVICQVYFCWFILSLYLSWRYFSKSFAFVWVSVGCLLHIPPSSRQPVTSSRVISLVYPGLDPCSLEFTYLFLSWFTSLFWPSRFSNGFLRDCACNVTYEINFQVWKCF